jgi:hypothetical protein
LKNLRIVKDNLMAAPAGRSSIEDLAQMLYEASDPSGIPWIKRGLAVRDPWLRVARQQIAQSENASERDGRVGP